MPVCLACCHLHGESLSAGELGEAPETCVCLVPKRCMVNRTAKCECEWCEVWLGGV